VTQTEFKNVLRITLRFTGSNEIVAMFTSVMKLAVLQANVHK
jgi:hypothetical protein